MYLYFKNGFNLQPPRKRYVDPTDKLILEEETQRIELNGNIDINQFVTGKYNTHILKYSHPIFNRYCHSSPWS